MNIDLVESEKIIVVYDKTASHNVDPQKGFTPLCPDELPVPDGDNIVTELVGQNELVAYRTVSKDMHPANAIWLATKEKHQYTPVEGENVDIRWNAHCMSGTKGAELLDGLGKMSDFDFFLAKGYEPELHPYSSCYHDLKKTISTGLIEWYNSKDISTVIVGGLALNIEDTPLCVGETIIDLVNAGFQVILNLGSTRGLGSDKGRIKFIDMLVDRYGVLVVDTYKDIEVI
jgi:nicotinamidase/pyrazinamidase